MPYQTYCSGRESLLNDYIDRCYAQAKMIYTQTHSLSDTQDKKEGDRCLDQIQSY